MRNLKKTIEKPINSAMLWVPVTDKRKLGELDDWRSYNIQKLFAVVMLTVSIFSASNMMNLASSITDNNWIALIYGFAFGFLILQIERSVLLSYKLSSVPLRIFLVVGAAFIYHIGFEIQIFRADIDKVLYQEATPAMLEAREGINRNEGQHSANLSRLQRELSRLETERRRLASRLNRETNGKIDANNPYNVSGIPGYGRRAVAIHKELEIVKASLKRTEQAIENEHARYANARAVAEAEYEVQAPGVEVTPSIWSKLTAVLKLSEVDDVHRREAFISLRLTSIALSLFIEMLVLILKFTLSSNYLKKVKDDTLIAEEILDTRKALLKKILDHMKEPESNSSEQISHAKTRLKSIVNMYRYIESDFRDNDNTNDPISI